MIKENELRLGSLVCDNAGRNVSEICGISREAGFVTIRMNHVGDKTKLMTECWRDFINPLDIKGEIMERFGFEFDNSIGCPPTWSLKDKDIMVIVEDDRYVLDTGNHLEYGNGITLKSVHHMQNLIMAMYGVELNFNLFDDDYPGDSSFI